MPAVNVASLFAGIGGICLGFKQAGAEIVWANEVDHKACETYKHNFNGAPYLVEGDVYEQSVPEDVHVDIVAAGFPCQAFSVAGYRKGFEDDRGVLYTQVVRIIRETQPRAVLLENVKNLMTHDNGNTYRVIKESLEAEGYVVTEKVLNSMEYGNVPQNRERIYIVAFKEDSPGSRTSKMMDRFSFPEKVPLTNTLDRVFDKTDRKAENFYYPTDHIYYDRLNEAMVNPGSVYQWRRVYARENKSGVCPTLTANMGEGGHNVPIIRDDFGIRKITPEEALAIQGFPSDYSFPRDMAMGKRYKQIGNSVSVPVVRAIATSMLRAME